MTNCGAGTSFFPEEKGECLCAAAVGFSVTLSSPARDRISSASLCRQGGGVMRGTAITHKFTGYQRYQETAKRH